MLLTTLSDLLFTASAIGLVTVVAGLGVAVLPWRATQAKDTRDAFGAAISLPSAMLRASFTPGPTPAPAVSR
jgi:uncharacterized protein YjeT (DUF2065 family)